MKSQFNIKSQFMIIIAVSVLSGLSGAVAGWFSGSQSAYKSFQTIMKEHLAPPAPTSAMGVDSKQQPYLLNNQTIEPVKQLSLETQIENLNTQLNTLKKELTLKDKDKKEVSSIINEIKDEYELRKEKENYVNSMRLHSSESIKKDIATYGNTILDLYKKSQKKNNGTTSDTKLADEALMTLTQEFPKSETTGIVLAERALQNAMEQNFDAAEQYYQLLNEHPNASTITTENGVDALPALQAYLVSTNISKGNTEEATKILSELETLDKNRYIAMPPKNGSNESVYVTVGEFCEKTYNHLQTNNSSAPAAPSTAAPAE